MQSSSDRILTTHIGRLQRPDWLTDRMDADPTGRPSDDEFRQQLRDDVVGVVAAQAELGIDVVTDGEFGKLSWLTYLRDRLGGFTGATDPGRPRGGLPIGYEATQFKSFYSDAELPGENKRSYYRSSSNSATHSRPMVCTEPVTYIGREAVADDIANLKAALQHVDVTEAFIPAAGPGSSPGPNQYYETEAEFRRALADALREEYLAIVDAGFVLQVDSPTITHYWNHMLPDVDMDEFYRVGEEHVELLNYALRDIPPARVRVHICWGSWHGPHTSDVPLKLLLPLLRKMNVGAYAFEAGNVRHAHEWDVWREADLPEDRILIPGVVSHATSVVEHPELVARRLRDFASVVGRERVIAGTDCGLGFRVHPEIAAAKLQALAEGAELASSSMWQAPAR